MPAWNITHARAHGHSTHHGHVARAHSVIRAETAEPANPRWAASRAARSAGAIQPCAAVSRSGFLNESDGGHASAASSSPRAAPGLVTGRAVIDRPPPEASRPVSTAVKPGPSLLRCYTSRRRAARPGEQNRGESRRKYGRTGERDRANIRLINSSSTFFIG